MAKEETAWIANRERKKCPGVMNANVLKSKSLFCLDASYAPLHIPGYAGIRWNIVGGDACAHKRIKGWDKGRYTHTHDTHAYTKTHTYTHFLSLSLFLPPPFFPVLFSLVCTCIHCRLTIHLLVLLSQQSPLHPLFLSNLSAALTVISARYRVACTFCL